LPVRAGLEPADKTAGIETGQRSAAPKQQEAERHIAVLQRQIVEGVAGPSVTGMPPEIDAAPGPGQRHRRLCLVDQRAARGDGYADGKRIRIELVAETRAHDVQGQIAAAAGRNNPCVARGKGTTRIAEIVVQIFEAREPVGVKQSGLGTDTGDPAELPGRGRCQLKRTR
jgi:hypothetical protein